MSAPELTPIQTIAEAARVLRGLDRAATPAPWRVVIDDSEDFRSIFRQCDSPNHPGDDPDRAWVYDCCSGGELHGDQPGFNYSADAEYAATMRQVAGPLAALLADIAAYWAVQPDPNAIPPGPLAVARAVLGQQPTATPTGRHSVDAVPPDRAVVDAHPAPYADHTPRHLADGGDQ